MYAYVNVKLNEAINTHVIRSYHITSPDETVNRKNQRAHAQSIIYHAQLATMSRRVFVSVVATSLFWFIAAMCLFLSSPSNSNEPKGHAPQGKRHVSNLGAGQELPAIQLRPEDEAEKQAGYSRHAFNQLISDRTPLDRPIPDTRDPLSVYM